MANAADNYALGYWSHIGQCNLRMVIGTNNDRQCIYSRAIGYTCNITDAGEQWAQVLLAVRSWLTIAPHNYSANSLIVALSGSDIEQGTAQNWDCANVTRNFVDGYNSITHVRLVDFGDDNVASACWTEDDVFYVSWQAPADIPQTYQCRTPIRKRT